MVRKPIAVLSTDWHLKTINLEVIKGLVIQKCELAKKLGVKSLFVLGDIFDSRVSQRIDVLRAFYEILEIVHSYGMKLNVIPGNHDKTVYSSKDSFLDPFQHHPALFLARLTGGVGFSDGEMMVQMIPYFSEEIWMKAFTYLLEYNGKVNPPQKIILLSHTAVTGSKNNDGTIVETTIKSSLFKSFHKVFLGHYHNAQKIGDNIYHIPSIQQNNYGEDPEKGFTVLYEDGEHEFVKSEFKEYKKIKIDLDTMTSKMIDKELQTYSESTDNIRFEFTGSDAKLKSLKKEKFTQFGIDVKTKSKEIELSVQEEGDTEVVQFDLSKIKDKFKEFCKEQDLDFKIGVKYL